MIISLGYSKLVVGGINPLIYHRGIGKFKRFARYLLNPQVEYQYGGDRPELNRERLRDYAVKPLLIHSYEQYALTQVLGDWFHEQREEFLGKSAVTFDLIILRDPYNTFASSIKRGLALDNLEGTIEKWLEHAREYLGISNYLPNRVGVNYNNWFTKKDYRQELAATLGLPFTDAGIDSVPAFGKGSSFHQVGYDGKASQMGVLSRYQNYLDHPVMQTVVANEEVRDLASQIFGETIAHP